MTNIKGFDSSCLTKIYYCYEVYVNDTLYKRVRFKGCLNYREYIKYLATEKQVKGTIRIEFFDKVFVKR